MFAACSLNVQVGADAWGSDEDPDDGYDSLEDFIVCKPGRNYHELLEHYDCRDAEMRAL
jgi:hypothetical protein